MSAVLPTTSVHSVPSRGSAHRYNQNIDDLEDADDALMENADIAAYMPTNDEINDDQMIYSLSDDGKLLKRRVSRSHYSNNGEEEDDGDDELLVIQRNGDDDDSDQDRENEHAYDDEEYPEQEETGSNKNVGKSKTRLYQHPVSAPKFTAGKSSLSIAQAKLFGLLDKDGNFNLRKSAEDPKVVAEKRAQSRQYLNTMSQPTEKDNLDPADYLAAEDIPTFKPSRSKEAQQAMRNPRCGYDFMDRVDGRGNFLDRVDNRNPSGNSKLTKSQQEALERDYNEKHDKLQCPRCLMPQSFKEFFEKSRKCLNCHVKFEKLNITSGTGFLKKNEEREKERQAKLRAIEIQMYGVNSKPSTSSQPKKDENNTKAAPAMVPSRGDETGNNPSAQRPKSSTMKAPASQPIKAPSNPRLNQTQQAPKPKVNMEGLVMSQANSKNAPNAAESMQKMVALNNQKAEVLHQTLQHIHQQYGNMNEFLDYDLSAKQAKQSSSNNNKSSAGNRPPLPQKKAVEVSSNAPMSSKMDRLVNF